MNLIRPIYLKSLFEPLKTNWNALFVSFLNTLNVLKMALDKWNWTNKKQICQCTYVYPLEWASLCCSNKPKNSVTKKNEVYFSICCSIVWQWWCLCHPHSRTQDPSWHMFSDYSSGNRKHSEFSDSLKTSVWKWRSSLWWDVATLELKRMHDPHTERGTRCLQTVRQLTILFLMSEHLEIIGSSYNKLIECLV